MQIIDLGKLRLQMKGEWQPDELYESNDVVRYGGNLYVYHYLLSQSGRLPTNEARFALMLPGTSPRGAYAPGVAYRIGESVTFGGGLFRASVDLAEGQSPETHPGLWLRISDTPSYRGNWASGVPYSPGDLVTMGASTYTCLSSHSSSEAFHEDSAHWRVYVHGMRYLGLYTPGVEYLQGDMVTNGLHILSAKKSMTAPAQMVDEDWLIAIRGADYLPSMLTSAGKFLSNDGLNPQWVTPSLSKNPTLLAEVQAQLLTL